MLSHSRCVLLVASAMVARFAGPSSAYTTALVQGHGVRNKKMVRMYNVLTPLKGEDTEGEEGFG